MFPFPEGTHRRREITLGGATTVICPAAKREVIARTLTERQNSRSAKDQDLSDPDASIQSSRVWLAPYARQYSHDPGRSRRTEVGGGVRCCSIGKFSLTPSKRL